MKITLEIPDGMRGAFFNGIEEDKGDNLQMVSYRLDSSELYDGAEIKLGVCDNKENRRGELE